MKKTNVNVDLLETKLTKNVGSSNKIDGNNVEWLKQENALDHLIPGDLDIVSSKFDDVREPKVQNGLKALEHLEINGIKLNPLIILLGKWWEHKAVRKEVKTLLDQEAIQNGYDPAYYLQEIIGKQIEVFADFQTAIDRIKYAKTYYIPRGGIKTSLVTKQLRIDGELYNVPIVKLNEVMERFPNHKTDPKQRKELTNEVKKFSELVQTIDEL